MLKFQKRGDFFLNRGDFRKKVGITLRNVGIFEEKIGGDKWGFLIAEVGISTLNFLATLFNSMLLDLTLIVWDFSG